MLTSITIENFRSIRSVTIDDLSRVNIFVGQNGSGKTSALEAILLASNPSQPGLLHTMASWREMPAPNPGNDDVFSTMFRNGDSRLTPKITFVANAAKHVLMIAASQDTSGFPMTISVGVPTLPSQNQFYIPSVVFTLMDERNNAFVSRAMIVPGGLQQMVQSNFQGMGCFYIHARRATSVPEMAHVMTTLSRNRKSDEFVKALKSFDSRINNIECGFMAGAPMVLVDLGGSLKLPVNVLGDGFCRASLIITGLFAGNANIVAVDEIDSGLHVSVMPRFWTTVAGLSRATEKQIMCVTHNEDLLNSTIGAFADRKGDLRIYRLDRTSDEDVVATKYTYDTFVRSEDLDLDIR